MSHTKFTALISQFLANINDVTPLICLVQEDNASDHEAAMSVDEEPSNGGAAEAQAQDQVQGESSSGGKKQKNQKKKFDISLPAQHLVSNSSNLV